MSLRDVPVKRPAMAPLREIERPRIRDGRAPAGIWAAAAVVLLLAALALGMVASADGVLGWDRFIAQFLQFPRSDILDRAAWLLSRVGDVESMVAVAFVIAALLAIRGRRGLAVFLLAAAALRALGPWLKALFGSPRPPADFVNVIEQTDGFGYPSGHALGAALLYGAIAVVAPAVIPNRPLARAIQVAAVLMIFFTAWARVRLGVHWPSDVCGGALFGLGFVCLLVAGLRAWRIRT